MARVNDGAVYLAQASFVHHTVQPCTHVLRRERCNDSVTPFGCAYSLRSVGWISGARVARQRFGLAAVAVPRRELALVKRTQRQQQQLNSWSRADSCVLYAAASKPPGRQRARSGGAPRPPAMDSTPAVRHARGKRASAAAAGLDDTLWCVCLPAARGQRRDVRRCAYADSSSAPLRAPRLPCACACASSAPAIALAPAPAPVPAPAPAPRLHLP